MGWSANDHQFMGRALKLAAKGKFTARPNPMVGCVIVKQDKVVGQGWHQYFGESHAEINALAEAGESAVGATCYVTLEPCAHIGKTGACAEALKVAGVTKVIAAMKDPNPAVSGKGFSILESAGISTSVGLLENQARELNRGFISRIERKRPWVTVKMAMSLDGKTALNDGSSQWITGAQARNDVQQLRAKQDAVITGIGTQTFDNPSLTARIDFSQLEDVEQQKFCQPVRVLLDREGLADISSKFFNSYKSFKGSQSSEVWWVTQSKDAKIKKLDSEAAHVKIVQHTELSDLLADLARQEVSNALVEAGHKVAGRFLQQGLVDEIVIYLAPKLMGDQGMSLFELPIAKMKDCPKLMLKSIRQLGDDIRLIYQPLPPN